MWRTSLIPCILLLGLVVASPDPVIKISKGLIRGQNLKSRNGRGYSSFTGVPYAKPPIDELRFKVITNYSSYIYNISILCLKKSFFLHDFSLLNQLTLGTAFWTERARRTSVFKSTITSLRTIIIHRAPKTVYTWMCTRQTRTVNFRSWSGFTAEDGTPATADRAYTGRNILWTKMSC